MCGICGFVRFDKGLTEEDSQTVRKMSQKLVHRGPDSQGTLLLENVALGFTRLSIIGLENGMQPLFNEDESLLLVCNGEIFNYVELRESLKARGHRFKTDTDVEVILHLYEEKGVSFLNELNGQFAFALYDKKKRQLFCARDQMGIIPFFYTFTKNTFVFGSEIKAILDHPLVIPEVNMTGLDQVFTFAGLVSPTTMFKDIHSLENGHYLLVKEPGHITKNEYWDLPHPINEKKPESYYLQRLEELIDKSIRLRLRADVPSGLYVSGGLDSSIIAAKVNRLVPDIRKEMFSIDFKDVQYSESSFQKIIAKECNANLNQKMFSYDEISDRLKASVYYSECPIKETYNTASLSLSEAVRSLGLKVILSGEGADEFFAGYVGYRFDKMRKMNLIQNPASREERELRLKLWGDEAFFYERNYLDFNKVKRKLYSKRANGAFDEFNCLNNALINKDKIAGRDILNTRAYIDYKIRLVDHLVSDHGDRMAMANSVEVRYPFLDKDLVEFSTQIPSELKLHDLTEKFILRKIGEEVVPRSILDREKFHFVAPGSPYLLQKKIPYIQDVLSYDLIKKQGYFDPDEVEKLKKSYSQEGYQVNAPYESDLLITIITFGMFLENFMSPSQSYATENNIKQERQLLQE